MSGLALFFHEAIKGGVGNDDGAEGDDTAVVPTYAQSLWCEDSTTAVLSSSRGEDEESKSLTVNDWRTHQKIALSKYFNKRLLDNDEPPEEVEAAEEPQTASSLGAADAEKHTVDEMEEETAVLETQGGDPDLDEDQGTNASPIVDRANDATAPTELPVMQCKPSIHMFQLPHLIPHVSQTSGDITNLAEIDLYTQSVSLSLCHVDFAWPQRDVRRMKKANYDMSRYQFDGPVSVLYNPIRKASICSVVTLELQQIPEAPDHEISELRRRVQQLHHRSSKCGTMTVFLYGAYADKIQQLLDQLSDEQKKQTGHTVHLYMGLRTIPAMCVMPLATTDWYDAQTDHKSPYCLCIGDETSMQLNDGNETAYFRLDDAELGIDCLLVSERNDTTQSESDIILARYEIVPDETKGASLRVVSLDSDNGTIQARYEQYRQSHQETPATAEGEPPTAAVNDAERPVATTPERHPARVSQLDHRVAASQTTALPSTPSSVSLSARKRQRIDECKYETLSSLLSEAALLSTTGSEASCTVSLYAAVVSFTQPTRTKRGQWMMSIVLVDESIEPSSGPGQGNAIRTVNINIFVPHKHRARLPSVRYAGDGLRLNNIKVQQWKGDLQLAGLATSSYVVFRGLVHDPEATKELSFYPTDEESTDLTPVNKAYMLDMWQTIQRRFMTSSIMKNEHRLRVSDLSLHASTLNPETTKGDLTVMITAIIPIPEKDLTGVSPRGFLRVWDGTGPSRSDPLPRDHDGALEAISDGDPPSAALIAIADIIKRLQVSCQNPTLQPPITVCGRVTNVAVWERQHWDLIQDTVVTVGSFVRLRNVDERNLTDSNLQCLHVHDKSSFTPLPSLNYEVIQLLEDHNSRLIRNEPTNPSSGLLPLSHDPQANNSLRDGCPLQAFIAAPGGSKFEGILYISRLIPSLTSQSTGDEWAQICQLKQETRWFRFGLCLKATQSSTTIEVLVLDDIPNMGRLIGEYLFGMSATEAMTARVVALNNYTSHVRANHQWRAGIQSVASSGQKFFVLSSLETN